MGGKLLCLMEGEARGKSSERAIPPRWDKTTEHAGIAPGKKDLYLLLGGCVVPHQPPKWNKSGEGKWGEEGGGGG